MAIIQCADCGGTVTAYGRQKRCQPCQAKHHKALNREQARRERTNNPEGVKARKNRWRETNRESVNAYARENNWKYRASRDDWRDERRFSGLKSAVLKRDNGLCRMCGAGEIDGIRNITIHHIDGDKANNVMGNLITLCRTCHPQVHNRWNGAGRQDELRSLLRRGALVY